GTPADAALLLAGVGVPVGELDEGIEGLTVATCPDLHLFPLADDVQAAFDSAVRALEELGARLVEVAFPEAGLVFPAFGVIQRAEALRSHREAGLYPARAAEYGADVRGRLELASDETLDSHVAASAGRERVRAGFGRLFAEVDLVLTPIAATSPPTIEEQTIVEPGADAAFRESIMTYTTPQDLVGLPACAVRAGFDRLGIPVGVQLTGPPWSEGRVVRAAHALHEATPPASAPSAARASG